MNLRVREREREREKERKIDFAEVVDNQLTTLHNRGLKLGGVVSCKIKGA